MKAHPSATHVHVGCDEVFHLGECAECAGRNRNEIFVEHVTAVARYVRQAHKRQVTNRMNVSTVQGSAKIWALGCVNPASWLLLAAGDEFTQPTGCFRVRYIFHPLLSRY